MQLSFSFNVMVLVREECLSYGLPPFSRGSEETSEILWTCRNMKLALTLCYEECPPGESVRGRNTLLGLSEKKRKQSITIDLVRFRLGSQYEWWMKYLNFDGMAHKMEMNGKQLLGTKNTLPFLSPHTGAWTYGHSHRYTPKASEIHSRDITSDEEDKVGVQPC